MNMNPEIGTLAWLHITGGKMTGKERAQAFLRALITQLPLLPKMVLARLGLHRAPVIGVDPARLRFPDSRAAREAETICRELTPPFLANHSWRVYLWGWLLAEQQQLKFDEELFYIAALLHDVGLSLDGDSNGCCFTLVSADRAGALARAHGWTEARSHALAEAITLHMNVSVAIKQGAEAHLLHEGAAFDVIGKNYWQLENEIINKVLGLYPRLDFKREFPPLLRAEAARAPNRARFLCDYLMFTRLIKIAPFAE